MQHAMILHEAMLNRSNAQQSHRAKLPYKAKGRELCSTELPPPRSSRPKNYSQFSREVTQSSP